MVDRPLFILDFKRRQIFRGIFSGVISLGITSHKIVINLSWDYNQLYCKEEPYRSVDYRDLKQHILLLLSVLHWDALASSFIDRIFVIILTLEHWTVIITGPQNFTYTFHSGLKTLGTYLIVINRFKLVMFKDNNHNYNLHAR